MSKLFVVGTPIGNLSDMSLRGLETLRAVDFIAAEDTRVSAKLLNHYEIKKPMISYHAHNIREKGEQIVSRILAGESCAIITDAGMPCISDPGEDLVRLCQENGVKTEVVPGPSAVITALAVSGLTTARFTFEGFLSVHKSGRFEHLNSLKQERRTLVFYEAPHKLRDTLQDMLTVFGNRRITLARELTKLYEEIIPTTLEGAVALYQEKYPKGEYVLVLEGATIPQQAQISVEEAVEMVQKLHQSGIPLSAAAKDVAIQAGHPKGELYKLALKEI